jgi:hypothetical protein
MLRDNVTQRNHLAVRGEQIFEQGSSAFACADESSPRISLFKRNIDHRPAGNGVSAACMRKVHYAEANRACRAYLHKPAPAP